MQYIGECCPVCRKAFTKEDDIVVCPECGTPHHRACYAQQNQCANAALHGTDFVWTPAQTATAQNATPVSTLVTQKPLAEAQKNDDGHNIVFCPQCGAENAAEEPVCTECGARLYSDAANGQPFLPSVQLPNGAAYGYRAGMTVISPTDLLDGNTVADTAEYVQTGARRYIPKFYYMEKTGKKVSWNWAAFLFAPYWYFYRKMYALGAIFMVLLVAVGGFTSTQRLADSTDALITAEEQIAAQMEAGELSEAEALTTMLTAYSQLAQTPEFILRVAANTAISLFSGLFANYIYKKKAAKDIARFRAESKSPEEYRLRLFKQGGVSVFLCLAAFWIYELGGYLLSTFIFGNLA